MSALAFVLLWIMVFTIPGEEVVLVEGIGTLTRIIGSVALFVGLLFVLLRRARRRLTGFHVAMFLFVLWASITLFWTTDPTRSTSRLLTYLQLALFAWLIWELALSRTRVAALLQAYVLGAYVAAASTLYLFLGGATAAHQGRYAAFDDPNALGSTMALAIPMAWYLSLGARDSRLARWVNLVYIPVGLTAIILTGSRGAFIVALASLLIIPWTMSRLRLGTKATVYLGAAALLYFVGNFVPEGSWERLATIRGEVQTGAFGARGPIWRAGLKVFAQHPLIGVGVGAFPTATRPILGESSGSHQAFLSVAVEQGLVGLMLFIGMFAANLASIPRAPPLERKLSAVLLLTLGVALLPLNWDYKKQVWLVLSLVTAQATFAVRRRVPNVSVPRVVDHQTMELPTNREAPTPRADPRPYY